LQKDVHGLSEDIDGVKLVTNPGSGFSLLNRASIFFLSLLGIGPLTEVSLLTLNEEKVTVLGLVSYGKHITDLEIIKPEFIFKGDKTIVTDFLSDKI
jgi:hypothetical protein